MQADVRHVVEDVLDDLHHLTLGHVLHDDVAHRVVALDRCPILIGLVHEAVVESERHRNQRVVAIVVRQQFALKIGVEARVPRKRLGDRPRNEAHVVVRDVVAGRQLEPDDLQFLREGRNGLGPHDVAELVDVVRDFALRVQQDAAAQVGRRLRRDVCRLPGVFKGRLARPDDKRQSRKCECDSSLHGFLQSVAPCLTVPPGPRRTLPAEPLALRLADLQKLALAGAAKRGPHRRGDRQRSQVRHRRFGGATRRLHGGGRPRWIPPWHPALRSPFLMCHHLQGPPVPSKRYVIEASRRG